MEMSGTQETMLLHPELLRCLAVRRTSRERPGPLSPPAASAPILLHCTAWVLHSSSSRRPPIAADNGDTCERLLAAILLLLGRHGCGSPLSASELFKRLYCSMCALDVSQGRRRSRPGPGDGRRQKAPAHVPGDRGHREWRF